MGNRLGSFREEVMKPFLFPRLKTPAAGPGTARPQALPVGQRHSRTGGENKTTPARNQRHAQAAVGLGTARPQALLVLGPANKNQSLPWLFRK